MQMILKIYRNNEQVNEITSEEPTIIYKNIAQALYTKETKRATKTQITKRNNEINILQKFDQYKTQLTNTTYTYKYKFVDVEM